MHMSANMQFLYMPILSNYYRPQRSCEGYVFTHVCLSMGGGGNVWSWGVPALGGACSGRGACWGGGGLVPGGACSRGWVRGSRRLLLQTVRILLECILVTVCRWSLGQGNISQSSNRLWFLLFTGGEGSASVSEGSASGSGGAFVWTHTHTLLDTLRKTPPSRDGHWSGWYASYWNAFLLFRTCASSEISKFESKIILHYGIRKLTMTP